MLLKSHYTYFERQRPKKNMQSVLPKVVLKGLNEYTITHASFSYEFRFQSVHKQPLFLRYAQFLTITQWLVPSTSLGLKKQTVFE